MGVSTDPSVGGASDNSRDEVATLFTVRSYLVPSRYPGVEETTFVRRTLLSSTLWSVVLGRGSGTTYESSLHHVRLRSSTLCTFFSPHLWSPDPFIFLPQRSVALSFPHPLLLTRPTYTRLSFKIFRSTYVSTLRSSVLRMDVHPLVSSVLCTHVHRLRSSVLRTHVHPLRSPILTRVGADYYDHCDNKVLPLPHLDEIIDLH